MGLPTAGKFCPTVAKYYRTCRHVVWICSDPKTVSCKVFEAGLPRIEQPLHKTRMYQNYAANVPLVIMKSLFQFHCQKSNCKIIIIRMR